MKKSTHELSAENKEKLKKILSVDLDKQDEELKIIRRAEKERRLSNLSPSELEKAEDTERVINFGEAVIGAIHEPEFRAEVIRRALRAKYHYVFRGDAEKKAIDEQIDYAIDAFDPIMRRDNYGFDTDLI